MYGGLAFGAPEHLPVLSHVRRIDVMPYRRVEVPRMPIEIGRMNESPDRRPMDPRSASPYSGAIHAGQEPEVTTGAVNVPIFLTSTYAQQEIGKNKGYEYSRVSNPTRTALEQNLAALEGGSSAHVFASGMAAISALVAMLKTGDHVICGSNVYGGTPRLFNQIVALYGIEFTYVDTSDPEIRAPRIDAADAPGAHRDADQPAHAVDRHPRGERRVPRAGKASGRAGRSVRRQHIHVAVFSTAD